ncbi:antiterminator Q family protein [Symbiopectobacterium sp. RP]|uniref:antiterminator Q family protein n=1 Tax=Symbiopectobacterium sp. RP TaxID=3248553 RepID=UPI003D2A8D76
MRDIQLVLERWGAWAADDRIDGKWKTASVFMKGVIPSTKKSLPSCCDDDGIKIDAAIRRLKHYNSYYHQLIHMHYFKRQPQRAIANRLGISRTTLIKRLQPAEGFVEGCLAMVDITLERDKSVQKENIYEH